MAALEKRPLVCPFPAMCQTCSTGRGAGGHVRHRYAAGRVRAAEFLHDDVAQLLADLVHGERAVGAPISDLNGERNP
jgi:hypothetical protein